MSPIRKAYESLATFLRDFAAAYWHTADSAPKCRWCTVVLIVIVVAFTLAVFLHPTGGAG